MIFGSRWLTTTSISSGGWRQAAEKARILVDELDPQLLVDLANEPAAVIESHFGLTVEIRDHFDPKITSSVVGDYFPNQQRIVIGQALSTGRMRFTALHELAHHLIATRHEELALELMGPPHQYALEEAICDSFAGQVLIPDALVDEVLEGEPPEAASVVALHSRSSASRAAAAVRAAEHLGAPGHVMIADLNGVAQFTATRGIPYVVAPGAQQHDGGVVKRAASLGHATAEDHVTYKTGTTSEKFFANARRDGSYVFAVFTKGEAPWVDLHILPEREAIPREAVCDFCGEEFEYWRPHGDCGRPRCDHCGRCGCAPRTTVAAMTCTRCFLRVPENRMIGGLCNDCRGE